MKTIVKNTFTTKDNYTFEEGEICDVKSIGDNEYAVTHRSSGQDLHFCKDIFFDHYFEEPCESTVEKLQNIENISDKIGTEIYKSYADLADLTNYTDITAFHNSTYETGKYIMGIFAICKTKREYEIANNMLVTLAGYSIESLAEKIEESISKEDDLER